MKQDELSLQVLDEIMKLEELTPESITVDTGNDNLSKILENLTTAINETKKGNRFLFKNAQEMETKFEEILNKINTNQDDKVQEAKKVSDRTIKSLTELLLEVFDMLDLIYEASLQNEDSDLSTDIAKIIQNALLLMDNYGIEECEVDGQFIDGKLMISLGTVDQSIAPHLKQYQVFKVSQRGFRNKLTKAIVRKAKVITVY